jgi:hypothetical protein
MQPGKSLLTSKANKYSLIMTKRERYWKEGKNTPPLRKHLKRRVFASKHHSWQKCGYFWKMARFNTSMRLTTWGRVASQWSIPPGERLHHLSERLEQALPWIDVDKQSHGERGIAPRREDVHIRERLRHFQWEDGRHWIRYNRINSYRELWRRWVVTVDIAIVTVFMWWRRVGPNCSVYIAIHV